MCPEWSSLETVQGSKFKVQGLGLKNEKKLTKNHILVKVFCIRFGFSPARGKAEFLQPPGCILSFCPAIKLGVVKDMLTRNENRAF